MKGRLFQLIIVLICFLAVLVQADDTVLVDTARTADSQIISDTVGHAGTAGINTADQAEQLYPITPERRAKLAAYSQFKNIWLFIDFFLSLIILYLFLRTGLSAKIRDWSKKIRIPFFALWVYFGIYMLIYFLVEFPFTVYRYFLVEGEYGFINQTFGSWFSEELLTLGLTVLIGIIPIWFVFWLIKKSSRWWLWMTAGLVPFIVFAIVVAPVFIMPLYNDFVPLQDQQLKSEILSLADKAGIEGSDVFQVNASKQSSKINAYVTGLFGSERIVLYDTMIDNFSRNEIKFVMGHEMGHYVLNHIWTGVFISIFFIMFALWITDKSIHAVLKKNKNKFKIESLSDYASLPLLLLYLTVLSFLFQPLTNSISRYHEHQSDIFGMDISKVNGEDAARAFEKLSAYNLSDPDPHPFMEFWFYSHPALSKRIEFVRQYHNQT